MRVENLYSSIAHVETSHKQKNPLFLQQEAEGDRIFHLFETMGIWSRMEDLDRLEPAVRCAEIAKNAARTINNLALQAGLEPIVSEKTAYYTGLLFRSGQAIDKETIDDYHLQDVDPYITGVYKYPPHARERTIETSNVLKLSLLLKSLNFDWYARAVLHGPHPDFFQGAELPTVLAALANASLAQDTKNAWHSYKHPAVSLFSIHPYAQRTDELLPQEAKDWIDRAHMVAANTTLQHVFRMHSAIEFSDESFTEVSDELRQRWDVTKKIFAELGVELPKQEDLKNQQRKKTLLKKWMEENNIIARLQAAQREKGHTIHDHSLMVSSLMQHIAGQLNLLSIEMDGVQVFDEEYIGMLGMVHDAAKVFSEEEKAVLSQYQGYGHSFARSYPPEVEARGTVALETSHDAMLFAALKRYEDASLAPGSIGKQSCLADDIQSGPYHLHSFTSALLSYADLAVIKKDGRTIYQPDITERFLYTLRYISDPHTAIVGYSKLMTVAASLSWYLGVSLPRKGTLDITPANLEILSASSTTTQQEAARALGNIARVCRMFGIVLPPTLRNLKPEYQ